MAWIKNSLSILMLKISSQIQRREKRDPYALMRKQLQNDLNRAEEIEENINKKIEYLVGETKNLVDGRLK